MRGVSGGSRHGQWAVGVDNGLHVCVRCGWEAGGVGECGPEPELVGGEGCAVQAAAAGVRYGRSGGRRREHARCGRQQ